MIKMQKKKWVIDDLSIYKEQEMWYNKFINK